MLWGVSHLTLLTDLQVWEQTLQNNVTKNHISCLVGMLERRGSWSLGKKVPGSERLVTRQVKRLVLSGVIPTIQQQSPFYFLQNLKFKQTLQNNALCLVGMLNRSLGKKVPGSKRRTTTEPFGFVMANPDQQSNKYLKRAKGHFYCV